MAARVRLSRRRVFNYPTFSESYKVAALDADNRIKAMKAFGN